jgi:hypothetical protein
MSRIELPKEDFLKFVKKQLLTYPQCKVDEYIDIKYNKYYLYKNVKSKQQINTLLKIKQNKIGFYHYHRLLQLLSKEMKFHDYFDLLKILKNKKFDDLQVYKFIQKHSKKNNTPTCCGGGIYNRGGGIYNLAINIAQEMFYLGKYLVRYLNVFFIKVILN